MVITGGGPLNGAAPGDVVAFAWNGSWRQVPVQVDERAPIDLGRVYNDPPNGVVLTQYTDPGTFAGADPVPALDGDDEIALMARDSSERAPAGGPPGTDARSRVDFEVTDPAAAGRSGWFSLFRRTAPLDPGAGRRLVSYSFGLQSGAYKSTYRLDDGPQPRELLGQHPLLPPPLRRPLAQRPAPRGRRCGQRSRHPRPPQAAVRPRELRAHRGHLRRRRGRLRGQQERAGARAALLHRREQRAAHQREHVFYERREDIRTDLRVHAIGGIMDYLDYSPAAAGMTYRSSAAPGGVRIDGIPDSPAAGALVWESVDGPQGGLSISHAASTDISPLTLTSYYFDDSTPASSGPEKQCSGDNAAYGASGQWITSPLPNTDPRAAAAKRLHSTRQIYYEEPGQAAARASVRAAQANTPLRVRALKLPR